MRGILFGFPKRNSASTGQNSVKHHCALDDSSPSSPNRRPFTPPCRRWIFLTNGNRRKEARACFAAKKISRENRAILV